MTQAQHRVVVTGAGILTSLGDSAERVHAALCQGRRALAPTEGLEIDDMPRLDVGMLKDFDAKDYLGAANLRPLNRTARLAASAAKLALDAGCWSPPMIAGDQVGLVLGTMFGSIRTISELDRRALVAGPIYLQPMVFANTVINAAAGQTAIRHHLRGVNATVAGGAASGAQALAYATDLIRLGHTTTILAGGVEELCSESLYGFWRAGWLCGRSPGIPEHPLPCHPRRRGFALAEAAAILVLEDAATAAQRGAPVLAEILGHGSGFDRSGGRDLAEGARAVAHSLRCALAEAELAPEDIDALSLSANGGPRLDAVEAQGVELALGPRAAGLPVTAVKSMLGETLGASGALQTVLLIESMHTGLLPGIRGLAQIEDGFPLRQAGVENRRFTMSRGLVNSVDMTGKVCSLLLEHGSGWAAADPS